MKTYKQCGLKLKDQQMFFFVLLYYAIKVKIFCHAFYT